MSARTLVFLSLPVLMQTARAAPSAFVHYRPTAVFRLALPVVVVRCRASLEWEAGILRDPAVTGNRAPAEAANGSSHLRHNTTRDMEPAHPSATPLAHDFRSPTQASSRRRKEDPRQASTRWVAANRDGTTADQAPATAQLATTTALPAPTTAMVPSRPPHPAVCLCRQGATPAFFHHTQPLEAPAAVHPPTSIPAPEVARVRRLSGQTSDLVLARARRAPHRVLGRRRWDSNDLPIQLRVVLVPGPVVDRARRGQGILHIRMGRLWVRGPLPLRRWGFRRARAKVIA